MSSSGYFPAGADNDSRAPYNEKMISEGHDICPVCGSDLIVNFRREKINRAYHEWTESECDECGFTDSDEPDWDSL